MAAHPGRLLNRLPSTRRQARLAGAAVWMVVLWAAWLGLQAPYIYLRSLGDEFFAGVQLENLERRLFLGDTPTHLLQAHIFERDLVLVDNIAYVLHGLWFGIPFAFGIVLMVYEREKFMEYIAWQYVMLYIAALMFILLPVRPPWMEEGVVRILGVRHADYITLDNNPMAAMPSMHAGLPALTMLFFFLRCGPRVRLYGVVVGIFTLAVSAAVVYLGEHWVLDILGGYAVAGAAAWLCMSRRMRLLYARIPGDPVARLSRFNERMCASGPRQRAEPKALPVPEPLREAA